MIYNDHKELSGDDFISLREMCLEGMFYFVIVDLDKKTYTNTSSTKLSILSIFEIPVRICIL